MAYQTGSVANPGALATTIETFATANGWTLNAGAGSWLSKGQSHVRLGATLLSQINSITRAGTLATVAMANVHGLTTGNTVTIIGATDALYNGTYVITVTTTTQFTYIMSGTPAANAVLTVKKVLGPSLQEMSIFGANSSDGLTELCPFSRMIFIATADWPVTYELFYSTTPDQLTCVLKYQTSKIQVITFGDIVKINTAAYVGGNWFFATKGQEVITDTIVGLISFLDTDPPSTTSGNRPVIPFAKQPGVTGTGTTNNPIHCKIDGNIWDGNGTEGFAGKINLTDYTVSLLFRSPNNWNNQTHLVPIHLQFSMASSLFGYIGHVEHLRFVRIDNYEISDIITLGPDRWKVFPWIAKSTVDRNGSANPNSGTVGFAVRYDGP
jgi:hypothetical protein